MTNLPQAIDKIKRYCAYQERCNYDVVCKLKEWGVDSSQRAKIVQELTMEGYLDEVRFARAFVRGKFNIKSWGNQKIIFELKRRNINESCIGKAMEEIDGNLYLEKTDRLAAKWIKEHKEMPKPEQEQKLYRYLYSKGYEQEDILKCINRNIK